MLKRFMPLPFCDFRPPSSSSRCAGARPGNRLVN
jgi:hypothetical protein